jgi:tetratricopeptide (TPR) repeat protein
MTGLRRSRWCPVLAAVLAAAATAAAPARLTDLQRATILAEAQDAYDRAVATRRTDPEAARALFRNAAERFGQLADDGVANGALHYDLANAYLQAGELGRAILHYRAAEKLSPGDSRVQHNLEHARSLVRSRIAPSGERALGRALLGWHSGTTLRSRFAVFAAAWVAFWIVLGLNLFRPRAWWKWLALTAGIVWLACGASVAVDALLAGDRLEGVVVADDVVVRMGNGEGYEPRFEEPLQQGVEFRVLEQRPNWLRIELANEKTGWIRADQAGLLG